MLLAVRDCDPAFPADAGVACGLADRGAPDFILHDAGRAIGVELTRLVQPHDRRAGQSVSVRRANLKEAVLARARERWRERALPPVRVDVLWRSGHEPSETEREEVARQLVEVTARWLPQPGAEAEHVANPHPGWKMLPSAIVSVWIERVEEESEHRWYRDAGGSVAPLEVETLNGLIRSKRQRLDGYLRCCDEVWLLLWSELEAEGTWWREHPPPDTPLDGGFARVLVFSPYSPRFVSYDLAE